MASDLGLEFETDFSMDLFAELAPLSVLQLPEPEDVPMNDTTDRTLNNKQSNQTIELENITETPLADEVLNVNDTFHAATVGVDTLSADEEPQVIIGSGDSVFNMRLMVIVSMVVPGVADSAETLIHTGDCIIEVTPTTTIREIKQGITNTFDICYEDMALVFVGKFLSDSRTIEYYLIDDGETLHLLVESPNKLFKDVFEAFKRLCLSEEKAWFATRGFIDVMQNKYNSSDVFGNYQNPIITDELLLHELEQLHVPDSDESDDSSADEDVLEYYIVEYNFETIDEEDEELEEEVENEDEEQNSEDEYQNAENEYQNSEDESQNSENEYHNSQHEDYFSDVDETDIEYYWVVHSTPWMTHFSAVTFFK